MSFFMRRVLVLILLILLTFGVSDVLAQTTPAPAIITFYSDRVLITVPEVEAGETTFNVSWSTIGLTGDYRLILEQWEFNHFVSIMEEGEESLPPSGEREIVITSPQSFARPTYRLSILNAERAVIDEHMIGIGYELPEEAPGIISFTSDTTAIEPAAFVTGDVRVNIAWEIGNRHPESNPMFEQVLADGSAVSVELPREQVWIPSSGAGVVAPRLPVDSSNILLRLNLMNLNTGDSYGVAMLEIVVGDNPPTLTQPETTPEATAVSVPITSFMVIPTTVSQGEILALTWDVPGASSVQVGIRVPSMDDVLVIASSLPITGGLNVPIDANFIGFSAVTFVLRALDMNGNYVGIATQDVVIE